MSYFCEHSSWPRSNLEGPDSITSFVYYVSVAVCLFGCMCVCVCVWTGEDAGIRGIVQYVTFSKTYHFSGVKLIAWTIRSTAKDAANVTRCHGLVPKKKMSKFVDEITRLSLWIFYADRPVYIYDITLIWLIHFVNELTSNDAVNSNTFTVNGL